MFYAALALLATKGLGASKHSGVISLIDQHFVKPGILSKEMSRFLHKAFDMRQIGDYREFFELDPEQVLEILRYAKEFVTYVEAHLSGNER
jgi:uncharacterized protein (UPF0332 family)